MLAATLCSPESCTPGKRMLILVERVSACVEDQVGYEALRSLGSHRVPCTGVTHLAQLAQRVRRPLRRPPSYAINLPP